MGSVHCTRYTGAFPIGFWLAFWCAFLGIANRTRTVFAFCFVLESCKHQAGRIEHLYLCLVQQKTLQAQQVIKFKSVHFHPTPFTRPSFPIFWESSSETKPLWCHAYCHTAHTYPSSIAGSLQSVSQILMSPAKNTAGPTLDLWEVQKII